MKIKKTYNGVVPTGKVLNSASTSQNDTYSCEYLNDKLGKVINYYDPSIFNSSFVDLASTTPNNIEQICVDNNGLVNINLDFKALTSSTTGTNMVIINSFPNEARPPKNAILLATNVSNYTTSFAFYQASSGQLRLRMNCSAGNEININGSYYV